MSGKTPLRADESDGDDWLGIAVRTAHVAVSVSRRADSRIVDINPAFTRLFGYSRQEIIGRTTLELDIWPDVDERARLMQWLEHGGAVTGFEARFRNKAGEIGLLSVSARIVRVGGDDLIIGFLTDATEKKRLEEGLRVAQDRLHVIFAATQILAFHQDRELRYTWIANPALGVTEPDILGRTDDEMLGAEAAAPLVALKRRALQTGRPVREEVFVTRAGQSAWYDLIVEPERDAKGMVTGLLGAATDITARKEAQAVAAPATAVDPGAEQRLRLWAESFEHAQFGLAVSDARTDRFVAVNPAFARQRGYTPEELIGAPVTTVVPERIHAQRKTRLAELETSHHLVFETEHQRKDGEVFPVLMDLTLVRAPDGTSLNRVTYALDITERREQERRIASLHAALEQRALEAESATRAKTAFIANVSHEIRTPLNAITGMSALIRREGITPTQVERLDKLEAATAHLLDIVNDLLDLSQIEAGKLLVDSTPLRVDELIRHAETMVRDRANAKALTIGTEIGPLPPALRGDPKRIRQCLVNYLSNAVKFTESGSIVVGADLVEEGPADAVIRFVVTDTGIGIPADVLQRLFAPFEQGDNSMRRRFGGTGLGLAITRRLAQRMGGDAGAESTPGRGSRFWFTVRLEKGDATVAAPNASQAGDAEATLRRHFGGARILLVEDEPVNRLIARDLLLLAGLKVDEAIDGARAVEMVRTGQYDLVLMDMQMPHVDGAEATRQIRRLQNRGDLPVVALSANAYPEDRATCFAAGMDDFMAKPVDPDVLYPKVLRWLTQWRETHEQG